MGGLRLPLDAVRARTAGAGADGLGHRRDDRGRPAGLGAPRQCVADAAPAGGGAGAGLARRAVALSMARPMAALGRAGDRRRARRHGADPAARHRRRPFHPLPGGARAGPELFCRGRVGRADGRLAIGRGDRAEAGALAAGSAGRARLRRRSLPLFGAEPQCGDRHRRGRAAGRVRRRRCDRQSGIEATSLPSRARRRSTGSIAGGRVPWRCGSAATG